MTVISLSYLTSLLFIWVGLLYSVVHFVVVCHNSLQEVSQYCVPPPPISLFSFMTDYQFNNNLIRLTFSEALWSVMAHKLVSSKGLAVSISRLSAYMKSVCEIYMYQHQLWTPLHAGELRTLFLYSDSIFLRGTGNIPNSWSSFQDFTGLATEEWNYSWRKNKVSLRSSLCALFWTEVYYATEKSLAVEQLSNRLRTCSVCNEGSIRPSPLSPHSQRVMGGGKGIGDWNFLLSGIFRG